MWEIVCFICVLTKYTHMCCTQKNNKKKTTKFALKSSTKFDNTIFILIPKYSNYKSENLIWEMTKDVSAHFRHRKSFSYNQNTRLRLGTQTEKWEKISKAIFRHAKSLNKYLLLNPSFVFLICSILNSSMIHI